MLTLNERGEVSSSSIEGAPHVHVCVCGEAVSLGRPEWLSSVSCLSPSLLLISLAPKSQLMKLLATSSI